MCFKGKSFTQTIRRSLFITSKNQRNNYVIHRHTSRRTTNVYNPNFLDTNHYRMGGSVIRRFRVISTKTIALFVLIPFITISLNRPALAEDNLFPTNNKNDIIPDQCEACKSVIESFEKGMEKTMQGKHEGGDTSWEEKNLKNYADSEVRLVEIQEELCHDLSKGKTQCFSLAEEAETYIEDWWFEHRKNNVRLHDFLCLNKLKKCCPSNAFGPNCRTCSDCNNHGVCDGAGSRSGTGDCICQLGYKGKQCEQCQQDYYKIQTLNAKLPKQSDFSCQACHDACLGGCSGPSSVNCTECRPGYRRDPITSQCLDINECELNSHGLTVGASKLCPDGTYCQNTEGHYKCAPCHRACSTCLGYGRNKCIACASDHFMDEDHNCIYTRDYNRHDPNIRDDESFVAYIWRRFQTDIVLKIMMNILLYPLVRWVVEKVNYGSALTRKVIIFLATINLQMELYPFVQRTILANHGKD